MLMTSGTQGLTLLMYVKSVMRTNATVRVPPTLNSTPVEGQREYYVIVVNTWMKSIPIPPTTCFLVDHVKDFPFPLKLCMIGVHSSPSLTYLISNRDCVGGFPIMINGHWKVTHICCA